MKTPTYNIVLTHTTTQVKTYVAARTQVDGSWSTPHQDLARVYKTMGGAMRWLADRPEIASGTGGIQGSIATVQV